MRRWGCVVMGLLLVGCGGGGASVSTPRNATPVARFSGATNTPAGNSSATATRAAEQAQLSALLTQTAPSTPTVAPAATSTPIPTAIPVPPTSTMTASSPTAVPQPSHPTQFVSNIAAGPINLRSRPDTTSDILAQIPATTELLLLDADVKSVDGASDWVKVTYQSQDGYVRSDLVSSQHTALPTTTAAGSTKQAAPRSTTAQRSPVKRRKRTSR